MIINFFDIVIRNCIASLTTDTFISPIEVYNPNTSLQDSAAIQAEGLFEQGSFDSGLAPHYCTLGPIH